MNTTHSTVIWSGVFRGLVGGREVMCFSNAELACLPVLRQVNCFRTLPLTDPYMSCLRATRGGEGLCFLSAMPAGASSQVNWLWTG